MYLNLFLNVQGYRFSALGAALCFSPKLPERAISCRVAILSAIQQGRL